MPPDTELNDADLKEIALGRPSYDEAEVDAVAEVLESGWVAGMGPKNRELEAAFAQYVGADHAVAVSNCTAGLHLALAALDIGEGDDVLVADYTFPATGHSVLYTGARPVFVDVRADSFTIDVAAAEAAITPATKAIIAVDSFGQCADYPELADLAARHDVAVIEDAACSAGARLNDAPAGTFGQVACFSLHGRKGISCGEGGVVTTNDPTIAERVRKRAAFGLESALSRAGRAELAVPVFDELGWNYKLSDIQAAVALVQLNKLDALVARRNEIADHYNGALAVLDGWTTPATLPGRLHSWQSYILAAPNRAERDRVALALRSKGIGCNFGTYASHVQPLYGSTTVCPVSADLFERHLAIPMHADLSDADVTRVCEAVATTVGG